jgi:hypothetical protein
VTTNILRKPLYQSHTRSDKEIFGQDEAALFFVRTKLPWGSRVSILSVAIAVRSAIAEYSRLVIAIHRQKKHPIKRVPII